jgi:hypothetical protein
LIGCGFAVLAALLSAVVVSGKDSREQAEAARRGDAAVVAA